jgi:hypothetical protein
LLHFVDCISHQAVLKYEQSSKSSSGAKAKMPHLIDGRVYENEDSVEVLCLQLNARQNILATGDSNGSIEVNIVVAQLIN